MLERLRIRDYILINEIEIDFSSNLNILTGETGAGKSILIESISLLFGIKASRDVVRKGAKKATMPMTSGTAANIARNRPNFPLFCRNGMSVMNMRDSDPHFSQVNRRR